MILQIVVAIDMHALGVEKIYLHILKFWYNNLETFFFRTRFGTTQLSFDFALLPFLFWIKENLQILFFHNLSTLLMKSFPLFFFCNFSSVRISNGDTELLSSLENDFLNASWTEDNGNEHRRTCVGRGCLACLISPFL